ncbi:hypothetical protein H2248_007284 [Termitomyces sp. 'cryptogamus']|nr:hypothetical protein H2248_007284 [Termitomyces sp. 'cryptogamus']
MPYRMATGNKPDVLRVCKWGAHAYIKLLKAGKLDLKVKEEKFIGIDGPSKHKISIERDVYFSKEAALNPDNIQIEEEWGLPANLDSPQVSKVSKPSSTPNSSPKIPSTSASVTRVKSIVESPH